MLCFCIHTEVSVICIRLMSKHNVNDAHFIRRLEAAAWRETSKELNDKPNSKTSCFGCRYQI